MKKRLFNLLLAMIITLVHVFIGMPTNQAIFLVWLVLGVFELCDLHDTLKNKR